jgi:RHS repeat-associated protein
MPSGTVGNPPAVPAPTSTAGPADLATEGYDSPAFYYNLNDHLGTARITMNQSGAVTSSVEYFPFGELKSATGCAASSQRFTGKLFDNESGLQYFGARYLSNDLTRFTSVDPAASSFDPRNSQSWNRYAYSENNPLSFIDPDGRELKIAPLLNKTVVEMRAQSSTFDATLRKYEQPGSPLLEIKQGNVPKDERDGKLAGKFVAEFDKSAFQF